MVSEVGVVGAESLLGRELEDALKSVRITPFSANGEGGFAQQDEEAVFIRPLDENTLREQETLILAGTAGGSQKAYQLAKAAKPKPILIDCTGDLESQPEARIANPYFSAQTAKDWLLVVPHPAAQALVLALKRLTAVGPIRQSIAHVFEPASERGKKGIGELQAQTSNLLSFKALDKTVYDAQVAFNLLPSLGEDAPMKLGSVEQRIERHLATLISRQDGAPITMPSLRLVQAPVFHGYSISLWAEFERNVSADEAEEALASAQIEVRTEAEEPPDIVGVVGQSGLIAGDIRPDRNNGRALWIWLVADNLRLVADCAASIIRGSRQ